MENKESFDTDEKVLALDNAYTVLIKTLRESHMLEIDHLFRNLIDAQKRLTKIGKTGAANALRSLSENWTGL